jgi:signal transduction histidine kinase
MDVKLISQDGDLYRLCREILGDIPGHPWTITAVASEDADTGTEADLYLWDYRLHIPLPAHIGRCPSKHLFLINRKDMAAFRQKTDSFEATILLKPVTRATLMAFLGLAVSAYEERMSAASSLKADRDEILQCLIQTNLKLQEYDQDRTTFLARAVHDFRAPLTALSGYCGLLLGEPLGPLNENQKEVLQRMQHSAKRLSRMAAAMFQLSVGRQVKRRPELQKNDIRECLDQALHEIAPFADDKRISITVDFNPCDHSLYFECGQIEQVLINILDNACKFTPKGGSIEISGYPDFWERRTATTAVTPAADRRHRMLREPNVYRVDIRDSGDAMPHEYLDHIFEEYTSYAGGRDRSGGGLGLAISRLIVVQHDGRVWAENTEAGPCFSFVLPFYRREPIYAAEADSRNTLRYSEAR